MITRIANDAVFLSRAGTDRNRIRLSALAAIAGCALLAACGQGADKGGPPPGMAMPVSAIDVAPQKVPVLLESVGQTEGSREVEVRARVSGIVKKRLYQEGDVVGADAALFQIDRAPYEIALAQAKAALDQERAKNEQSRREAGRLKQLAVEKAISQKEFDDATSTFKQSEASVAAAEAKVREAELNLSYTRVTAPIAGVSGRAQRSEGSLVNAGTDSALLTTISQTNPIWVRFSFSESEYTQLRRVAKKAEVKLVQPDGQVIATNGHLNFTASTMDPRLGTVQMRAEFANPKLDLLPGQFARVRVVAGEEQAVLVPQSAVMQSDQGRFVWTVTDGKATPRPVEAGNWLGRDWVIRKGLAAGDKVIVDNLLKLRPGAPVAAHAPGEMPGAPKADAAKAGAPKADESKTDAPKTDAPKGDAPKSPAADPAAKKSG
jgi:membrane fusion protein (multidrug efflux system)